MNIQKLLEKIKKEVKTREKELIRLEQEADKLVEKMSEYDIDDETPFDAEFDANTDKVDDVDYKVFVLREALESIETALSSAIDAMYEDDDEKAQEESEKMFEFFQDIKEKE